MVVLNDSPELLRGAHDSHESGDFGGNRIKDNGITDRHVGRNTHLKINEDLSKQMQADSECDVKIVKVSSHRNDGNETLTDTDDKNIIKGHIAKSYLHEVNFKSKIRDDESEKLLNYKDDPTDLRGDEKKHDFGNCPDNEDGSVQDSETEVDPDLPIDRGWAWVILLASVCTHFIVIGQLKCFGIIFVQLQQRYGSSSSATSVIYTLMNATYSVAALIIMTIGGSLSARTSFFIGATISAIASVITAFIDDVNIALVTVGIAAGVANAFLMTLIATITNTYFVKKRGFANNVGNSGVSIGTIALAPIMTKLFENYAYTGTYIIITGLNLQLFVIACLLRPISFYKKKVRFSRKKCDNGNGLDETGDAHKIPANGTATYKVIPRDILQIKNIEKGLLGDGGPDLKRQISENLTGPKAPFTRRRRAISESEKASTVEKNVGQHSSIHSLFNSSVARFASTDVMNISLMDLTLIEDGMKQKHDLNIDEEKTEEEETCTKKFKKTFINSLRKLFDIKLLSKPEFQYFLACNTFLCAGSALATAFLAPLAYDNGISNDMVALMISVMSIIELLSRFVLGYISDKKWCHRSTLIAIASFILGLSAQFLHFTTTFSTIMIYAVISGLLQGVYFALFVVVILDILSFEDFKGALGFTSLVQGTASGICMPIVGYLRDTTGTYTYPYNFIGANLIIGAVLIYFIPNVHEWSAKREKRKAKEQKI